jgi:GNAT superfamily N-acetyltransferase
MLEPTEQGKGLGLFFLDAVRQRVVPQGRGTIILDCWAGNGKLREFYTRAGYYLHGVFAVEGEGFEVAVFVSAPPRALNA